MSLQKIVDDLNGMVAQVKGMIDRLKEPGKNMTLQDAYANLELALPKGKWTLEMAIDPPYHDGEPPIVKWKVWDGKTHHMAGTLADAVKAAILANNQDAGTIEQCEELLETA